MVSFMDLFAGRFGDERRAKGGLLAGRLVEQQSPIVHRLGRDRAGTVAFGRFLANRPVMPEEIFAAAGSALAARAAGRHDLAIQDTTHLSFPRRASEVIAPQVLDFAVALNSTLEGKTDKQKNPHQEASLDWFAWIVTRLGGWSGYQRYGPRP